MTSIAGQHIVVTGGCGFFGAWITAKLLREGAKVTIIDAEIVKHRLEMTLSAAQIDEINMLRAKIDEPDFINTLVDLRPDGIIHLAALQVPTCKANPVLGARVNVIGTLQVFEAAKALKAKGDRVPPIVYASSAAVFGPDAEYGEKAVGDLDTPDPQSHYGAYKLCCEYSARAYWLSDGIASVGLRPLTVYGPGRDTGLTSFPTRALAAALRGESFDIPFTGATAYIHVAEVADMFVACLHPPAASSGGVGAAARGPSSSAAGSAEADTGSKKQAASDGARVYTVGGDTADTRDFIALAEAAIPGAAGRITCSGSPLPLVSKLDDAALRRDYPAVKRIPLPEGIAQTVAVYRRMLEAGSLKA